MKEIFRLCFVLTLIAAISAGVMAYVSELTEEPIARAMLEEKMDAIRNVLPVFDNDPYVDRRNIDVEGGESVEIYPGKSGGELAGVAFEVVAPDGYSGDINFMIGVNMDGVVQGLEILKHLETPGLGAKIIDEDFKSQYRSKSLADPENWAVTKDGGTFVSISGATISSRAITKATMLGLGFFRNNLGRIAGSEVPGDSQPADTSGVAAGTTAAGDSVQVQPGENDATANENTTTKENNGGVE
ncbi:MAG: RnfABCDGE type electron transport complex subunit G [Candidatus Krumholzibacteria bacterium]|nr:RnfABCDGE type electron transport complex subunit G [Candidatus Krumholzibacteria bacterium]